MALTLVAILERLVPQHLNSVVLDTVDLLQFVYRSNRLVDDAVALAFHSILQHLDTHNTYARLLFLDYSSTFNMIRPMKLTAMLSDPGVPTTT